ncbi:heme-binding protein [Arthrobacter bambusae]|uniref:heme-degrading domain-containing protein n=1 Tax=Arthrobacter bambusae TaxID=1338426 RepID=UPI001F509F3F|nr:heme-binding protein [Arthrobacter bambusae]MCI0143005.1 heme-binding protein [Arthrobacter bambusae]
MTDITSSRLSELRQHEDELVFERFDHHDAWRLGSLMAVRAIAEGHAVAIDIRRHNLVLFRCVLPGATADQEEWIRRKSATTLRFEHSTALLHEEFSSKGFDPTQGGWLTPADYTLAPGSFPVRVSGTGVAAAATVSGLASDDDHEFVVEGIRAFLKEGASND